MSFVGLTNDGSNCVSFIDGVSITEERRPPFKPATSSLAVASRIPMLACRL